MGKLKRVLFVLLISLCAIITSGCATITYSKIDTLGGQTQEKITIDLNYDALSAAGVTYSKYADVKQKIKADLEQYFIKPITDFIKFYDESPNITQEQFKVIQNNIEPVVTEAGNTISASITFNNKYVYDLYIRYLIANSQTDVNSNTKIEYGFLFYTIIQTQNNVFGDVTANKYKPFYEKYTGEFSAYSSLDLSDLKFVQLYASQDTRLGSNADETAIENTFKMHLWEIDPLNANNVIQFYDYSPNTVNWYVIALVLTGFLIITLFFVYFNKQGNVYKTKIDYED